MQIVSRVDGPERKCLGCGTDQPSDGLFVICVSENLNVPVEWLIVNEDDEHDVEPGDYCNECARKILYRLGITRDEAA